MKNKQVAENQDVMVECLGQWMTYAKFEKARLDQLFGRKLTQKSFSR